MHRALPHAGFFLRSLVLWSALALVVGAVVGTAAAGFLFGLVWCGETRDQNLPWMLVGLPVAGGLVSWIYARFGGSSGKGNNLIIEEVHEPRTVLPFRMAPLVVGGTLVSHLFGASVGREGTAVQMGAVFADQLSRPFKLDERSRRIVLMSGIAAGFSALFGTPLAGAIFALEVFAIGRMHYLGLVPALFTAVLADWVCRLWEAPHTHYHVGAVPEMSLTGFFLAVAAGIAFGLAALFFSVGIRWLSGFIGRFAGHPVLKTALGGGIMAGAGALLGPVYLGLGLATIVDSFHHALPAETFAIKLALTVLCLATGFKGGEVTPLFFIGATLGNALSLFFPILPTGLLAAMGFVAVFAAAANTPIACVFMAVELFGAECLPWAGIACVTAYFVSGHTGIYSAQVVSHPKNASLSHHEDRRLADLKWL